MPTRPEASRSPRWLKRMDVAWPLPARCGSVKRAPHTHTAILHGIIWRLTKTASDHVGAVLREDEGVNERQIHGGVWRAGAGVGCWQRRSMGSIFADAALVHGHIGEKGFLPRIACLQFMCGEPALPLRDGATGSCQGQRLPFLSLSGAFMSTLHAHPPHHHSHPIRPTARTSARASSASTVPPTPAAEPSHRPPALRFPARHPPSSPFAPGPIL